MRSSVHQRSDIAIGMALLGLCVFMAWRTVLIRPVGAGAGAGPTLIPWIMIGGIALFSVWLIVRAWRASAGMEDAADATPNVSREALIRLAYLTALLVAYAVAFTLIGYLASTVIVFIAALALFGERRPLVLLLVPTAVTGGIYWGFTRLLNVWLP